MTGCCGESCGCGTRSDDLQLLNVNHESLRLLMTTDNTALAHTTRRLLEDIDDPEGVLSAFQSFPSGGPND